MTVRVGINGFGRIGRQVLKALIERHPDDVEVVGINDLFDTATNAHLFKYDSNYGVFPGDVEARETSFVVNGREIQVSAERDPGAIPWKKLGAQIVIESTGLFTDATKAKAHIDAGAQKVIISAPARNEDITVVLGVNEERYDTNAQHHSSTSCTINGLAPRSAFDVSACRRGLAQSTPTRTPSGCWTWRPKTCATRARPR
jgi:glyceraldehyde 3-phosphate dehydrogenase